MWYIFDTNLTWQGLMDNVTTMEINHLFYECDYMTFEVPYTKELYEILKIGRILYRGDKKGYRIHTLEVKEDEKRIIGDAYGLESLLNQRVIDTPLNYENVTSEHIMHNLVQRYLVNPADTNRKITGLTRGTNLNRGENATMSYYGENVYEVISELSKTFGIGYQIVFDPAPIDENGNQLAPILEFQTFVGTDRTINQDQVDPVSWRSSWGDTRDEMLLMSEKDYKNVVYLISGDQENPIKQTVGANKGWERYEIYNEASDISRTLQDGDTEIKLTNAQVINLLKARGNLTLYQNYKLNDFSFTLNEDIPQTFGKDYLIGDLVSLAHEEYNVIKHARITGVQETIIQNTSQFVITFGE